MMIQSGEIPSSGVWREGAGTLRALAGEESRNAKAEGQSIPEGLPARQGRKGATGANTERGDFSTLI